MSNIGTGERDYFIVDRTKIVQDQIRYEVQASQSSAAVEGMACEDPLIFGYVVDDSIGNHNFIAPETDPLEFITFLAHEAIAGNESMIEIASRSFIFLASDSCEIFSLIWSRLLIFSGDEIKRA